MHDRYVKIYNKNVRGKPSFVVLEDALMRKRIEHTLKDHYQHQQQQQQQQHCHAQQQTSSCDIGAHTGSQTDEFLLQCAMRSRLPGHSRGCQATDHNDNVELSRSRRRLQVPSLRRLPLDNNINQSLSSATLAAPVASAPHVTITFTPPPPAAATMPQAFQLPQAQQQHQLLLPAATLSYCNCSANLQPCISHSCNSCCLPASDTCFLQPQQQQQQQQQPQQQYPAMATTYGNCSSSNCCLLGPSLAQAALNYNAAMPQQSQERPAANWPAQACNHCHYYPMPSCNMAHFGRPYYAGSPVQMQQLQQQPQQQLQQQSQRQQQPQEFVCLIKGNSIESKSASQQLLQKSTETTPVKSVAKLEKVAKKVRYKLSESAANNKLYMARFGRTCLILKPNTCCMPPRLLTKPLSRFTSVIALPQTK
ncbi:hypothetical protein KR044_002465 [Drosophila immigrans]|nr:hypothetical protein KR044_002465 [Drosophila immigrans]